MTKEWLQAALTAEQARSYKLGLALKLLACHCRGADDELPPMHVADRQHITRMLEEAKLR